jgi:hypothetical protein
LFILKIKTTKEEQKVEIRGLGRTIATVMAAVFLFANTAMAAEFAGLKLSGFVDAAYADADGSDGTFSLDEVELDIEKELAENLSVRADLNYREVDDDDGTFSLQFTDILEQGYITYTAPVGNGVAFTIGKFNAPIGFELLDPVDMYQYSHALVFNFGLPTNLTGVMGSYAFTDQVDLSLYVVNGWDNNTDDNNSKTVGGRLGITPVEGVNIGFSAISGPEKAANTEDRRTVLDVDLTVTMVEKLTIGAEYNYGTEDKASLVTIGDDAKWAGVLVMAHYDFTDMFGLTVRYDWFDDKEGARLGNSVKETQQSYTIAPTVSLGDGAGLIVEYRRDTSDELVFNGSTEDDQDTVAVEFTYSF